MSFNRWNYVQGNPVNFTDPSGHDPWWCEGRYDEEFCYAQWTIDHGGKLTADILKSIYMVAPDQTLKLLQREFGINLPPGYQFRFALHTSTAFDTGWFGPDIGGATFWFTELIGIKGTIIQYSSLEPCGVLSSDIPSQASTIDYSVFITDKAFTDYKFYPDDIAGTMIHEAVHAWQESIVRDNLSQFKAAYSIDPRTSFPWIAKYKHGMERQAIDITKLAHDRGVIKLSPEYLRDARDYRDKNFSGPNFPVDIPLYGAIIR